METRGDPFDILISLHTPNLAKLDFQGNVSSHKYLLDMDFTNMKYIEYHVMKSNIV